MKHIQNKLSVAAFIVTVLMLLVTGCSKNTEIPITTSSDEALSLFLEGRESFELIEFDAAAQLLDQAIEKDSDFALAHLYRYLTGIGENLPHMEKAFQLTDSVTEGEKYLLLTYKAFFGGDGAKQKEYLDKLLELFPSDKRVQFLTGQYYNNTKRDFTTALKYYNQAIDIDKKYAPAYNNIGYCNISLGNYDEAEKAFKTQIELIPERPNPYDSYGDILMKVGKYDESIKQFEKAYEIDNMFIEALAGVGDNYIFKGEYEKAREYYNMWYENALGVSGKLGALYYVAISYVYEGEIEKALNTFERYSALSNENNRFANLIYSYQNEGFLLSGTGKAAEGLKRYQKALEVAHQADTPEPVKSNQIIYAMFAECEAMLFNNNIVDALAKIEELEKSTESRNLPNDEMWLNWLNGLVEYNNGNYKQAVQLFSNSWPDAVWVKYYIANAYKKMGSEEKADNIFKEFENWNEASLQHAIVYYQMN